MILNQNFHLLVCIVLLPAFCHEASGKSVEKIDVFQEEDNSPLFRQILHNGIQKSPFKGTLCRSGKENNNKAGCEKSCGKNEICAFENGKQMCSCKENFAKLGTTCIECPFKCGNGEICFFHMRLQHCLREEDAVGKSCKNCNCGGGKCLFLNGEKVCQCSEGFDIYKGMCESCDCGEGKCSFTENGQKRCNCKKGFLSHKNKCQKCDCGDKGKCSFENDVKTCKCSSGYKVDNGICKNCPCKGGNCSFVNGAKKCECKGGFMPRSNKCEECDCGKEGTCSFLQGNKKCSCNSGFMQEEGKCVSFPGQKANMATDIRAIAEKEADSNSNGRFSMLSTHHRH